MRPLVITFVFLCGAMILSGQEPQSRDTTASVAPKTPRDVTWRRHFVVRDSTNNVFFELTEIATVAPKRQEVIIVAWDHGIGRGIRFKSLWDREEAVSSYSAEELSGGSFFRVEFNLPSEGAVVQMQQNMELWQNEDAQLTLVTNGVRRTILESQWRDEFNARAWRTQLRSSLAPSFLESLERLRNGALRQISVLGGFHDMLLQFLYYGNVNEPGPAALTVDSAPPDCRFDAEMGHACSEAQLKRVQDAFKAGKRLATY